MTASRLSEPRQPSWARWACAAGLQSCSRSADLIDREFSAEAPGQRLVGDITYLRTGEGWLYLATVIDLATRMVVGWQTAAHMRTTLVVDALQMAIDADHVDTGAVFHSDRETLVHLHRVRRIEVFSPAFEAGVAV